MLVGDFGLNQNTSARCGMALLFESSLLQLVILVHQTNRGHGPVKQQVPAPSLLGTAIHHSFNVKSNTTPLKQTVVRSPVWLNCKYRY